MLTPDEKARREQFATELAPVMLALLKKHKLNAAEAADSMLTILIGIYLGADLSLDVLQERVSHAWNVTAKMYQALNQTPDAQKK